MPSVGTQFPVSANQDLMSVLGHTSTETLYYDYSTSDDFYLLVKPPEVATTTLYSIANGAAWQWFEVNTDAVIVYNPFVFNPNLMLKVPPQGLPLPPQGYVYLQGTDNAYLLGTDGDYLLGVV